MEFKDIKLKYGTVLEIPARVSDPNGYPNDRKLGLFIVKKYWESDTDPNMYKVRTIPVNPEEGFCRNTFYSSDLRQLINSGKVKIISE